MMKPYERLLKYVKVDTQSDPECGEHPSTKKQFQLAEILQKELLELGVADAMITENCLVYGHLEATKGHENEAKIGFIAHMDTAPDYSGKDVQPRLIPDYDGEDVQLEDGKVISKKLFPHLESLKGRTLIVTNGKTLLGADDKAGVAEIMTMIEILQKEQIPHGPISICFTPDEEVGMGTDCFDCQLFDAEYAYTVDGGCEGEVVYENFNAASATVRFKGVNVHTGSAKGVMVNAAALAVQYASMLPENETPETTEGYEGFFHLSSMEATVEEATLHFLIRDHKKNIFEQRKLMLRGLADLLNKKYKNAVEVEIKDSYQNMEEVIAPKFYIVERANRAVKAVGLEPIAEPIRGGTDGAKLSFMGLPTPNLGTGGYAYHGPYEHITVEGMDLATKILVNIARV